MRAVISLLTLLLFSAYFIQAQNYSISGVVLNESDKHTPMMAASILLSDLEDSTNRHFTIADVNGEFKFSKLKPSNYLLKITYIGYDNNQQTIRLSKKVTELGKIFLKVESQMLDSVMVEENLPMTIQKGDTVQFNAGAFKTNPDATAEDLITKMPGITIENGTIRAQGEDVQRVLVDGRQFFGDDPTIALRNLPAEIIEKIEVFDQLSDQAQFTGFDDGQSTKTINIVTRINMRNGQFGNLYAGYGTDDRYALGTNYNIFDGDRRMSFIGMANNTNRLNFSTEDLLGVVANTNRRGGRMGGGGMGRSQRGGDRAGFQRSGSGQGGNVNNFLVGQQNGITTTKSIGINFLDTWSEKLKINASYFFNRADNNSDQLISREFFLVGDSSQFYNEQNQVINKNYNHRINIRGEYQINSNNSLIFTPKLSFQKFNSSNNLEGVNFYSENDLINQSLNFNQTSTSGFNFSNNLLFRHRFNKRGRTFSINLRTSLNNRQASDQLIAISENFQVLINSIDSLDQKSNLDANGYSLSSNLVYTEPLGERGQLQFNYNSSFSNNFSNKYTYNLNTVDQEYSVLDTALSNEFDNDYYSNRLRVGYRYFTRKLQIMAGISYQNSTLANQQVFPQATKTDRSFDNILPNAMLRIRFSSNSNLRIFYRTSTNVPSINQLQNVVDNSNPLFLSSGNPNLKQETSNIFISRYSLNNAIKSSSLFVFVFVRNTKDYITNSSIIAQRDITLSNGSILNQGSQLTVPVNLDGYWNARSFVTFGLPIKQLKSNLNFNGGVTYTKTPGLINGISNISKSINLSQGAILSSNISEKVDFTLSYTANHNIIKNSIQPQLDDNYFYQIMSFKLNLIFWKGFVFRNELNYQRYEGLNSEFDEEYLLVNLGIGKKIFNNQRGEIKLFVYDLLEQNKIISRSINEIYLEDQRTETLSQYFMISFSYKFRKFEG